MLNFEIIVKIGGILFEYWFKLYHKKKYSTIIKNDDFSLYEDDILLKNKYKFISWLLFSFNQVSQKTLSLQKEFDHVSNIYSNSKKIQKMDFDKGLSGSIRTSQRFMKKKYLKLDYFNEGLFSNPANIIWIDNYSKFYKLSKPRYNYNFFIFLFFENFEKTKIDLNIFSIVIGSLQSCQWTAIGIIKSTYPLNFSLDYKKECPSYPTIPFRDTESIMIPKFESLKINLKKYLYFDSICDSINPNYSIPILDYSINYSLNDFFIL